MKRTIAIAVATAATILVGILAADSFEGVQIKPPYDKEKSGKRGGGSTTITYHNGPVLNSGPVNVYVIYYGDVPVGTQNIINTFFTDLNLTKGSFYAVNNTYYDSTGTTISPMLNFSPLGGSVYLDSAESQGSHLGSKNMPAIVQHAITVGGLPAVENAVYFVISGPSVAVSGFCRSFCAYHTSSSAIVSGKKIRFAVVPDPGNQCGGCDGNVAVYGQNVTPNGDPGADEMTDSIIHELSEAVTDPDISAWYTSGGAENGDLCNYTYGPTQFGAPNGATANFVGKSGNYYLIQQIWTNVSPQGCAPVK
jgi:hypothetical protein